jgi:SHS2 domain-containing protein
MPKAYRTFNHTADIGLQAYGSDLPEAFTSAARGMFSIITDLRRVGCGTRQEVEVTASDQEALLVEWLNELLFRFDSEQMLFKQFIIKEFTDTKLKAVCCGEKADRRRHLLKCGIKAATYHMLKIGPGKAGYRIKIILDI